MIAAECSLQYQADCNGLLAAIERACRNSWRSTVPDPSLGYMTADDVAVWLTKHVYRKARHIGLWKDAEERRHVA